MDTVHDTNNNTMEKIYSLRPRAVSKKEDRVVEVEDSWKPRGRSRKKTKQKSVPLSKYRRKTANARERFRMREINEAFEALRRAIPHLSASCENSNEKLTKISTLRQAMKYITALSNALQDQEFDSDADSFFSEWTSPPSSTPSSNNDHSDLYEHFFSPSPSPESSHSTYRFSSLLNPSSECSELSSKLNQFPPLPNYPQTTTCGYSENNSASREKLLPLGASIETTCSPSSKTMPLKNTLNSSYVPEAPVLEEDLSHQVFFTPIELPSCNSSFLDELDGLSPPSVDLDDYLLT